MDMVRECVNVSNDGVDYNCEARLSQRVFHKLPESFGFGLDKQLMSKCALRPPASKLRNLGHQFTKSVPLVVRGVRAAKLVAG